MGKPTINEFLVKRLGLSYEEVFSLLLKKRIIINGQPALQRQELNETDQVIADGRIVQEKPVFRYILYCKPRGVECTLNPQIPDNLLQVFPLAEGLFPVGRLDKESEGLLLLTNDGNLYKEIAGAEQHQEKEYIVEVDKSLTDEALNQLAKGVEILGQKTRPAKVNKLDGKRFRIILTQGLNRQIRRMCHKLGYHVLALKRIRIAFLELGDLKPGEYREVGRGDVLCE